MNNVYKIYKEKDILEKIKKERPHSTCIILDISSSLEGIIVHDDKPFITSQGVQHIEFFALSDGWYKFTSSGYKSHFFFSSQNFTEEELNREFLEYCESEGMNIYRPVLAPTPLPEQISLF